MNLIWLASPLAKKNDRLKFTRIVSCAPNLMR